MIERQEMIKALNNMVHSCSHVECENFRTFNCTLAQSLYPTSLTEIDYSPKCGLDKEDLKVVANYCKNHMRRNRQLQLSCDCPLLHIDGYWCHARRGGRI